MSVTNAVDNEKAIRTSRVGRRPVVIPSGVEVKLQGENLAIKGPKGQLAINVHPYVKLNIADKEILLNPKQEVAKYCRGTQAKLYRSITGTMRAQIANMVKGVTEGFEQKLLLVGVGYRAQMKGHSLSLSLGFSHPVEFAVPAGLVIETPSQTEIIIKGTNKELVGLVAAQIRGVRNRDPYKGKGVRYANEVVVLKETNKKK